MDAASSTPGTEQCRPPAPREPTSHTQENVAEPAPSPGKAPKVPASIYDEMPPLEGSEDSDEEGESEVQGTVCTVNPVPKGRGRR